MRRFDYPETLLALRNNAYTRISNLLSNLLNIAPRIQGKMFEQSIQSSDSKEYLTFLLPTRNSNEKYRIPRGECSVMNLHLKSPIE